jgi:transglutaminase-like putative cysteine protease
VEEIVMMDVLASRPLIWFARRLGVHTLLSLTLLLLAAGAVALGLATVVRDLNSSFLLPLAAGGLLLGWVLAKSPLPGWSAAVLGVLSGVVAVLVWIHVQSGLLAANDLPGLVAKLNALLLRVRSWMLAVAQGETVFDPVAATLVWSWILWLASVWAGWSVRRRGQALQAVTPMGALLAIGLSYAWADANLLIVLLGVLLLLMAATRHIAREQRWQASGIDFSPELRFDLALVALSLALLLALGGVLAPSVSVRPLVKVVERLMVEHLSTGKALADSMGLEASGRPGFALSRARVPGLPNRSLIGSGPELSEQKVMIIEVEGTQRASQTPGSSGEVPRLYWRGLTFDEYTGRGWQTGDTETVAYDAGELAILDEDQASFAARWRLRQQVYAADDVRGLLYRAGELVTADHDFSVAWRSNHDVFGAGIEADIYQVDSMIPVVSQAQLRSTGRIYPDWVRERYLSLPPDLPRRVMSLARDLTASEATPFDQSRAIETYLRTIPYTLDLPAPPPDRDVADYFLFDLKKGYCDYYATSMVVLARVAGLPARLVTGYSTGELDPEAGRYVVTAADAHSWVEIFFPGYGWVQFEPTAGRPSIERPEELDLFEIPEPNEPLEAAMEHRAGFNRGRWLGLLGIPLLLALGVLAWWVFDSLRLRRLPPVTVMDLLYKRLYRHARRLAVPVEAGDTPYEFAEELTQRVSELARDRRLGTVSTDIDREVHWLTGLFVRGLYSQDRPLTADRSQAIRTWQRLRRKLWLAWIWHRTNYKNR